REDRRNMRLERRLVLRKACVAIDPIERCFWACEQIRRKKPKVFRQLFDERDHWTAKQALVLLLARSEPLTVIVSFQRTKETDSLRPEARMCLSHLERYRFSTTVSVLPTS